MRREEDEERVKHMRDGDERGRREEHEEGGREAGRKRNTLLMKIDGGKEGSLFKGLFSPSLSSFNTKGSVSQSNEASNR